MIKPFEEVLKTDSRFEWGIPADHPWAALEPKFAAHHAAIAAVMLPPHVSAEVRTIFTRAQYAFLYAWFEYELTPLAELQALAAVETALREHFGGKQPLQPLAERAVKAGFFPKMLGQVETSLVLGRIRNMWAHGSSNFGTPAMALNTIEWCADLISMVPIPST